jgi:asparagine synthase (glutamine-hydrolysing)
LPGIAGIIGRGRPNLKRAELDRMVGCMMHEAFYNTGTYVDDRLGMWFGWVSHEGSFADGMPIWNEQHDLGIIFSGENYVEPAAIRALGSKSRPLSPDDAGYLVHLYEDDRSEFFQKLNGRFCGVIIDLRSETAGLFNDRYGLNRVYYFKDTDAFFFSSEAKSLLSVSPRLRSFDLKSLGEYFACGCALQNRTIFSDISAMPGGSAWTFAPGRSLKQRQYFQPETWENQEPLGAKAYYNELKEAWARLLPRYLGGKERIALSLTGGKDSRMIMAWAPSPPGALPCYTFGGMYWECADVKLARSVAKVCGQPHQVIPVDEGFLQEFPRLSERAVYLSDGAMDVSGATELYVNKAARSIAPVRLTGNYAQEILRSSVAFGPVPMDEGILDDELRLAVHDAWRTYDAEKRGNGLSFVAFKQVPWHHFSRLTVELSQLGLRSPFLDNDLVSLCYRRPPELANDIGIQLRIIAEGNPALARIETDRDVLLKPIPFVSGAKHLYKEFTFRAEYAYDYGMPQWLAVIDHAFRRFHFERLFLGRHKFSHFRIWYRDKLSSHIKEILLDPRTLSRSYYRRKPLEKMIAAHISGKGNYTSEIHRLLTTELVHRIFIDGSGST